MENKDAYEQLLKFAVDTLKEGKEFVVEQAPQVVQELIAWQRAWLTFVVIFWVIVGVCLVVVVCKHVRYVRKVWPTLTPYVGEKDAHVLGLLASVAMLLLVWCLAVPFATKDVLKVWFAPRVYVIEYVGDLLKKK